MQRPRPGYREDDGPAESGEFDRVFVGAVSAMAAPPRIAVAVAVAVVISPLRPQRPTPPSAP
jgi:hypothetical protein